MSKKLFFSLFIIISTAANFQAQRHELGIRFGASNIVGDIGKTNYILQALTTKSISKFGIPAYGGIIYRMNFNPYQTLRFDLGYNHVQFQDIDAKE